MNWEEVDVKASGSRRAEGGGRRTEELDREERKAEGTEGSGYTHKNLGCVGDLDAAVSDIRFGVPHKAQMGELRESLCDNLDEIWSDICDSDSEALDGAWGRGGGGEGDEGDDIPWCVLQLHLGVFFWL